ncbi:hypothetical protein ACOSQ2_000647 [Xanthoceras sorbifolium]
MALENGLNSETYSNETTKSKGQLKAEKGSSKSWDRKNPDKSKENEKTNTIPFHKLFKFAYSADVALMIIGTVGALGNGLCMPLMTILTGQLTDAFGQNQNNSHVVDVVSKVCLKFVYLAMGAAVASFLRERQAARIRGLYLKTILRQDIGFFDNETNTGEVVGRMSGDTVLIQDAMGEKVGKFLQFISTFFGGFVIAFTTGWLLTLVLANSIPLIIIAGGVMVIVISKSVSRGQNAYAKAATVVEQTIGAIKTTGSGKSTVISLIERFYDPQAGEVLIDGINLKGFQLKWIRKKIGLVSQEPVLFTSSIKDNIAYGKDGATIEEIRAAAEIANAATFIDNYPSALDSESERIVQEALDKIMDPEGAYSQLTRFQEVNKELEQAGDGHNKSELIVESFGQSSLGMSLPQSISRRSSFENSSHHSSSIPFGLPTGTDVTDFPEGPPLQSDQVPEVSISRLACLNKPEIPVLLIGTISAAANGAIFPVFGVLTSYIISSFYKPPDELKRDTRFYALMFVVLGVASLLTLPARTYFFSVAGCKLTQQIRSMHFEKVVHMEVGWFDEPEHSSGAIGARLSADAASIRALVGDALAQMVQNVATAVAGLVIAFIASWELAFIILALIPLIGVNGYIQIKFLKGFSADAKAMSEEASQVANDAVGSIRTVASFCAEEKVMQLYQKKCVGPMISGAGFGLSFFMLFSFYATSFYAGARLGEGGKIAFADVFRFFFSLTMTAIGISQSSSFAPDTGTAKSAAASIFAIIDRKSQIDASDECGMTIEHVKGEIEICHVSFKYPLRPDIQIFQDLSLSIHAGKTRALVGESGSGKLTMISLLQRFYDPDSGRITLDGVEIQKLQSKWLRRQMGLVSQEPILFNDTIRSNIAYGKVGNATEEEIIAPSELANAHNFISSLHQGYNIMVGERGIQLSGGQKQRVVIARAIIKSPNILLLDEATSALDAEFERVVQNALDRVMKNRITIVVAHRLSTIKNTDVIVVVKNGVIVLINIEDGFYASLVSFHTCASTV